MTTDLVLLAVLMFAATYPSRAVGLLTPGLERLPRIALDYLQLVGPAILTARSGPLPKKKSSWLAWPAR